MAEHMKTDTKGKTIPGFIQWVGCSPVFVFYWSEQGIRIWHDLCRKDVSVIDATGRVVRRAPNGKKYLFYELSIRSPIEGKSPIPIMSMISTVHSATFIKFWIAEFRRCEKVIFGHSNMAVPCQIKMDRAMVFIIAILEEFNHETLKEFLDRSWRIVRGEARDTDLEKKTVPHACASHVMNDVKKLCKKYMANDIEYRLWCFSTLLNCSSFTEAERICEDMAIIFYGKKLTNEVQAASQRMHNRIKALSTDEAIRQDIYSAFGKENAEQSDETPEEDKRKQKKPLTEEDFLTQAVGTRFEKWAQLTLQRGKDRISSCGENEEDNGRYSPAFLDNIMRLFLPTIPLWSALMTGDLSRHGDTAIYKKNRYPGKGLKRANRNIKGSKTTSVQDARFNVLKNVILGGRSRNRLDIFSNKLYESTKALQKDALKTCLKSASKNPQKADSKLVEEQWAKKGREPEELHNKHIGKYQQMPRRHLPVTKTKKGKQGKECDEQKRKSDGASRQDNTNSNNQQIKGRKRKQNVDGKKTDSIKKTKLNDHSHHFKFSDIGDSNHHRSDNDHRSENERNIKARKGKSHDAQPKYRVNNTLINPMSNIKNSCWFNASMQAVVTLATIKDSIRQTTALPEEPGTLRDLVEFIQRYLNCPGPIRVQELRELLTAISEDGEHLFPLYADNDAHEFIATYIYPLLEPDNILMIKLTNNCRSCHSTDVPVPSIRSEILIHASHAEDTMYPQVEVEKLTNTIVGWCQCKKARRVQSREILDAPRVMFFVIQRHQGIATEKCLAHVEPTRIISLEEIAKAEGGKRTT